MGTTPQNFVTLAATFWHGTHKHNVPKNNAATVPEILPVPRLQWVYFVIILDGSLKTTFSLWTDFLGRVELKKL